MGKIGAETIISLADALGDKRRNENVETCKHIPELDQRMLLALNKPSFVDVNNLPKAGDIMKWLQERLVSVTTSDEQSAVLGFFYTNIAPFDVWQKITVGIFPLYNDIEKYTVLPEVDTRFWQTRGEIRITDGPSAGVDPFLIEIPGGVSLLFFRKSPFKETHPYKTVLPDKTSFHLDEPKLHENALEENVIKRALWYTKLRSKPRLFTQPGFYKFIRRNRASSRYSELYAASKKRFGRSFPMYNF